MAFGGRDNWNAVCDGVENRVLPEWMSNDFIALELFCSRFWWVDLKVSALAVLRSTDTGISHSLLRPVLMSDTLHLGMNLCLWDPVSGCYRWFLAEVASLLVKV